MQTIKSFLTSYSITTHSVVAAIASLIGAYYAVPQFHALALLVYGSVPGWAQTAIMAALALYLRYSTGLSAQGKLAVAADSAKAQPEATTAIVACAAKAPDVHTDLHVASATQKMVSVALCLTMFSTLLPMAGCSQSTAQIAAEGKAVSNALLMVANIENGADPAVGERLTQIANSIAAITSNWQTGSSEALFNDAANAAEVVLAQIPQTAIIAPLIPIAVAAIDLLIETIHPPASPAASGAVELSSVALSAHTAHIANPYKGAKIKHRLFRSKAGDIKAAWNEVTAAHPELKSAELK